MSFPYSFAVPEEKKIRLIINTDAKNEADDQYAIVFRRSFAPGDRRQDAGGLGWRERLAQRRARI